MYALNFRSKMSAFRSSRRLNLEERGKLDSILWYVMLNVYAENCFRNSMLKVCSKNSNSQFTIELPRNSSITGKAAHLSFQERWK